MKTNMSVKWQSPNHYVFPSISLHKGDFVFLLLCCVVSMVEYLGSKKSMPSYLVGWRVYWEHIDALAPSSARWICLGRGQRFQPNGGTWSHAHTLEYCRKYQSERNKMSTHFEKFWWVSLYRTESFFKMYARFVKDMKRHIYQWILKNIVIAVLNKYNLECW